MDIVLIIIMVDAIKTYTEKLFLNLTIITCLDTPGKYISTLIFHNLVPILLNRNGIFNAINEIWKIWTDTIFFISALHLNGRKI